jgi:hypothetical protein
LILFVGKLSIHFVLVFELTFVSMLWYQSSVERLKVSKHLAEEAMNYFEECVSISTLDSTDFSSLEDPQINSVVNIPQKSRNTSFNKGGSSIAEIHYPTDRHWHNEVSKSMLFHFTEALRFVVLFRNINPSTQQPPSFF